MVKRFFACALKVAKQFHIELSDLVCNPVEGFNIISFSMEKDDL